MATASRDGRVRLWTLDPEGQLSPLCEYKEHDGYVNAVALCPNFGGTQELIVASAGADTVINLYNVREEKLIGTLVGHAKNVCFLKYAPPGRLLSCSWDGCTKIWDGLHERFSLSHDGKAVWSACLVDTDLCLTGKKVVGFYHVYSLLVVANA